MNHLMLGRSPSARHDGRPWTAKDARTRMPSDVPIAAAALIQIRGDWDWYAVGFRFRSPGGDPFCWKCEASKSGALTYQDTLCATLATPSHRCPSFAWRPRVHHTIEYTGITLTVCE